MKNVAVLALAAAVAVGSVTGVSAAVKSPTSSLVPVNAKNVAVSNGNTVDTKANGTAEVGVVSAKKSTATVPSKVTAKGVTYTVTVIKAKAFAKKAKKAKKIVIPATIKRVNKKGFTGTKKLKTIIVKGTKSFTVKKGAFKKVNSKKITVKVNKKMKAKEFKKLKKNLKKASILLEACCQPNPNWKKFFMSVALRSAKLSVFYPWKDM